MTQFCRTLAANEQFQGFILFLILCTAGVMGFETVPDMVENYGGLFLWFGYGAQAVFVFEILVRLVAFAPRFREFFRDFWNCFDFAIVLFSLIPGVGGFALVARLLRILRVLRIFSVSDRARIFLDRLRESFDEAAYAAVIALALGYIFTISGYFLFFELDPARWGGFSRAAGSVFYLLLLQDVPSYVSPLIAKSKLSILYFFLFYFVFISLLIAVVSAAVRQTGRKDV